MPEQSPRLRRQPFASAAVDRHRTRAGRAARSREAPHEKALALTLAGAVAAGARADRRPARSARAQVGFSVGFGGGYYGWGWPAASGGLTPLAYHGGYAAGYYGRTVVTRRVVTAPTYYVTGYAAVAATSSRRTVVRVRAAGAPLRARRVGRAVARASSPAAWSCASRRPCPVVWCSSGRRTTVVGRTVYRPARIPARIGTAARG